MIAVVGTVGLLPVYTNFGASFGSAVTVSQTLPVAGDSLGFGVGEDELPGDADDSGVGDGEGVGLGLGLGATDLPLFAFLAGVGEGVATTLKRNTHA